ncbi:MAG: hypothetical protein JO153_06130, partial [Solirubrobacterales bacterium]|nr:hypothetical protein [Solirubrobacterales bacterium]
PRSTAALLRGGAQRPSRESHSADQTERVTIHYPWHPLFGQSIEVLPRGRRSGTQLLSCVGVEAISAVPAWMTDAASCVGMIAGPAQISIEALIELRTLIDSLGRLGHGPSRPTEEENDEAQEQESASAAAGARERVDLARRGLTGRPRARGGSRRAAAGRVASTSRK